MGQTIGVATNSKGHLFVYSRSVNQGIARGGKAAMLWEFDQNYKFVKEWGPNNYAESFAHAVRVDKQDNVWQVDEGSGMIVKYDPAGQHIFWLGRTPEAIDYLQGNLEILHFSGVTPPRRTGIRWQDGDIRPRNRCGLGFAGQYLRVRRLRQLARRQDFAGRPLAEGSGDLGTPFET